ncbi:MAG: ATP-binding protein [Pyrinomonadaceae bacterium]
MRTKKKHYKDENLANKLQMLIIGRLLVTFLLLIASWVWNSGHLKLNFDDFPQGLFLIFLIAVGLTIIYFFMLRMSSDLYWQIRVQFLIDIILVTVLIWRTGDVNSPYLTLYIVLISVSSIFVGKRATLIVSILCVLSFTGVSIAAYNHWIISFATTNDLSRIIQIIGIHSVAFLAVGLLSAKLAERHASAKELETTTRTLANLRVLHERIIESIRSGLITIDLDGKIYTFNKTAEEITGYEATKMHGTSIYEIFGDITREIRAAITGDSEKNDSQRHEVGFNTPDGFVMQLGYSLAPLVSEEDEKTGLIITFQDLTEIRSMEESVRRKDRLAAVGRVAAGLAHEIRNPLGAMRGAIQVLELKYKSDAASANLMEIILRESDRLNEIISNFLKYARPKDSNFEEIDLRRPINDTITLLQHSPNVLASHKIFAQVPDKPVIVSADEDQLKQIFWNLARNSVQSMPDGGEFEIKLTPESDERVTITFRDTGCGMSPTQVEKLFEPFSKSTTGGTGLGLSIVYQIVRDHNGTINVTSKENGGTTITIQLPTEFVRKFEQRPTDENNSHFSGFLSIKHDDPTI